MNTIKQVQLATGTLYVEIDDVEIDESSVPSGIPDMPQDSNEFEDTPSGAQRIGFQDNMRTAVDTLRATIDTLASDVAHALERAQPNEWTVEFNIGFKGKTQPIPVVLSGEANAVLKVKASWQRQAPLATAPPGV